MRCRLSNTAAKFGFLAFRNGCENADQVKITLAAGRARIRVFFFWCTLE